MNKQSTATDLELFVSSGKMGHVHNYHNWTYQQFEPFLTGKVLEVGCGVGNYTHLIAKNPKVQHITSIDLNEKAVTHVKTELNHFKNLTVKNVGIEEVTGKFDVIVCMNVLEHIEKDQEALNMIFDLLEPNGLFFLLVPAHQFLYSEHDRLSGHFRRYSKHAIRKLVKKSQFRLESMYYFNPIGAMGSYFVYNILKRNPLGDIEGEIGFFDKFIVPLSKILFPKRAPFGISVIALLRRD